MSDNSESLEISARQLREHPLCQYCAERAIVTPAKICAHDGDKLRSLCMQCHTVTKRHIEQFGYRLDVCLDGFPCDPRHPFNRGR